MSRRALALAVLVCSCSAGNAERSADPAQPAVAAAQAHPAALSAPPRVPPEPAAATARDAAPPAAGPARDSAPAAATTARDAASPAAPAPVEPLGNEEGAELFGTACTSCHTSGFVQGSRISEKAWGNELAKMRKWGALVDEEQAPAFAAWLARKFPVTEPAPEDPRMSAKIVLATTAATAERGPLGDPAHGLQVFAQACASCHGPGALGTGGGPSLVENPVLRQRERFALLIRAGKGRMPGFDDLKANDVASLVAFLRGLAHAP